MRNSNGPTNCRCQSSTHQQLDTLTEDCCFNYRGSLFHEKYAHARSDRKEASFVEEDELEGEDARWYSLYMQRNDVRYQVMGKEAKVGYFLLFEGGDMFLFVLCVCADKKGG